MKKNSLKRSILHLLFVSEIGILSFGIFNPKIVFAGKNALKTDASLVQRIQMNLPRLDESQCRVIMELWHARNREFEASRYIIIVHKKFSCVGYVFF